MEKELKRLRLTIVARAKDGNTIFLTIRWFSSLGYYIVLYASVYNTWCVCVCMCVVCVHVCCVLCVFASVLFVYCVVFVCVYACICVF